MIPIQDHALPHLGRVADLLEEAAREIRSLGGTFGIPLPSLRCVEAQCDSNGQEPEEEIAMTPPTAEATTTPTVPELMTRAEIVALLRIHPRTFGRMLANPDVKFPEPIRGLPVQRWRRTTIERWLAERAK